MSSKGAARYLRSSRQGARLAASVARRDLIALRIHRAVPSRAEEAGSEMTGPNIDNINVYNLVSVVAMRRQSPRPSQGNLHWANAPEARY
jgi:hypothetical protein